MDIFDLVRYKYLKRISKRYYDDMIFDMSRVDKYAAELADNIFRKNNKRFLKYEGNKTKIAFFATVLYDIGGHTQCLLNLAESFYENEKFDLYMSTVDTLNVDIPKKLLKLNELFNITAIRPHSFSFDKYLIYFYNKIIEKSPEVIFLYIHPIDVFFSVLICLLKKNTKIKVLYFNHASHYPNMAMTFADFICEGTPSTVKVTNEKRHLYNTRIVGIQSKRLEDTIYYSKNELDIVRKNLGIQKNELMTISGGSSYKFFENEKSEYFEMIKNILEEKQNLKHIIMSNFDEKEMLVIEKIFNASSVYNRLKIIPMSNDFEKIFQAADLYIDSFPISGAMTQIDLMRLKVASIVKINIKNPQWSFHEYMPSDYPYMFSSVEDMKKNILELLDDSQKRQRAIMLNYNFWCENLEQKKYRKKIEKIVCEVNL